LLSVVLFVAAGCGGNKNGFKGPGDGDGGANGNGDGGTNNGNGDGGPGGNGADAQNCGTVSVNLSPDIPTVVLVVDQSGSMTMDIDPANPTGNSRWDTLYTTLMQSTGPVQTLQADVYFGITLFHGGSRNDPTCPRLTVVDPALNNFSAIDAVYSVATPSGGTPTGDAITSAETYLKTITRPGARVIALATDGDPNTCADSMTTDTGPTIAAEQDAFSNGIETYVVGVGPDALAQNLQDMANAGVGLPVTGTPGPGDATWYRGLDETGLDTAFGKIIGGARGCTFTINGDVVAPDQGNVVFDGTTLQYGTDWQIDGTSTLEILGPTCQTILAGGNHTLDASWPCGGVIIG
jgi:hypothetical protein